MSQAVNMIELQLIQYILRKQILPLEKTKLEYQIGKNLSKIDRELKDRQKLIEEIEDKFSFKKDDKKILFKCIADHQGKILEYLKNEQGEYIETTEEDPSQKAYRIDINNEDYIEAIKKVRDEEFSDFHTIPEETIQKLSEEGILKGVDLAPLLGTIIV